MKVSLMMLCILLAAAALERKCDMLYRNYGPISAKYYVFDLGNRGACVALTIVNGHALYGIVPPVQAAAFGHCDCVAVWR